MTTGTIHTVADDLHLIEEYLDGVVNPDTQQGCVLTAVMRNVPFGAASGVRFDGCEAKRTLRQPRS
jgi:hypothetical protein